jgi:hypothetical protein
MSVDTLLEIQDAVTRLSGDEKRALSLWLNSEMAPEVDAAAEEQLLKSLDRAVYEVDAGRGVAIEEVRKQVTLWAVK